MQRVAVQSLCRDAGVRGGVDVHPLEPVICAEEGQHGQMETTDEGFSGDEEEWETVPRTPPLSFMKEEK